MDGSALATLVLTDEPFNVANVGHVTGNPGHREFAMAHGEMSREEFAAFNRAWMSAVLPYLVDGGLLATFIDWRSVDLVIASGLALELALLNLVVWEKSNGGQGSLWRSQHELLPGHCHVGPRIADSGGVQYHAGALQAIDFPVCGR